MAQWTNQTIDDVPEFGLTDRAVLSDRSGQPHVFVAGDRLYHYWLEGRELTVHGEVLDPRPRSGLVRAALGPTGEFHLLYEHFVYLPETIPGGPPLLVLQRIHATNVSGRWLQEPVPDVPVPDDWPLDPRLFDPVVAGFAIGPNTKPHVLLGVDGFGLWEETPGPSGWVIERVDTPPVASSTTSDHATASELGIDAAGNPAVFWYVASNGDVVLSRRDATGWHATNLTVTQGVASDAGRSPTSLLVEPGGAAHLFFQDSSHQLVDLTDTSGSWTREVIGGGAKTLSTALDSDHQPHVLWMNAAGWGADLRLIHSWRTSSGWASEPAWSSATPSTHVSLAIDANGTAHAAALFSGSVDTSPLLYLKGSRLGFWSGREIARRGETSVSRGADVRISLAGHDRRLLYRDGNPVSGLFHLYRAAESNHFEVESLPAANGWTLTDPHVLEYGIDPLGREHALWISGKPIHAVLDQGSWSVPLPITDDSGTRTRRPVLLFDEGGDMDAVFSAFSGPLQDDLRHAALPASASTAATELVVTHLFQRAGNLALAHGPLGSLELAWVDTGSTLSTSVVRKATNASGSWVTSEIGQPPPGMLVGSNSVAIGPDGSVDLVYEKLGGFGGAVADGLFFGSNRCHGLWNEVPVDPLVAPGLTGELLGSRNPELVLDSQGNPHVSYRRVADSSVEYARIQDRAWTIEPVETDTASGESSAIAIDDEGSVSIAHHDWLAGSLTLATRAPVSFEPHWDACPDNADPTRVLEGSYLFETPPGSVPFYDPSESFDKAYGDAQIQMDLVPIDAARLSFGGVAQFESVGFGSVDKARARISSKSGQIRVDQSWHAVSRLFNPKRTATVKVTRQERIDPVTRQRAVTEKIRGQTFGANVKLDRTSTDLLPIEAFGVRLQLTVTPGRKNKLALQGQWLVGDSFGVLVLGDGIWHPDTKRADLRFKARSGSWLTLTGVRVDHVDQAGVQLRADSISISALGQKIQADLSSAY